MKKKENGLDVYKQLALDFGPVVAPQEGCKDIPIPAARAALDSQKKKGVHAQSRFTAFFSEYMPNGSRLLRCFDNMEEAENQIYNGFCRWPDEAEVIDRVFPALYSTEILGTTGYNLYVAHMIELIDRVGSGNHDLETATDGEVIAAIHGISLITPTRKFVGQGYWHLFQKIFPGKARELYEDMQIFAMPEHDYEREQVIDFIELLRKKLRVKGRALSSVEHRTYSCSMTLKRFFFTKREYAPAGFFESKEATLFLKYKEVAA